jgi:restriction system protein
MTNYYRVMLGKGGMYTSNGIEGNYIGVNFNIPQDLTGSLPDQFRAFNQRFIPIWLEKNPNKTRVAAGLACGMLWTVAKGIVIGDIILTPDGTGNYHVGEVTGEYQYEEGELLPHQRPMRWYERTIARNDMSDGLKHSAGFTGTVSNLSAYGEEIVKLIGATPTPSIIATDETIEDPYTFALEKHLEDFLIQNWPYTALGKDYDIYKEDGGILGQQYLTDTGSIDILAISKNKKTLLVVELKRGRANDAVVGQVLRYMGYVKDELAETDQNVRGVIIAMEDEQGIRRALSVVPNIDFYRYEVTFKLNKG